MILIPLSFSSKNCKKAIAAALLQFLLEKDKGMRIMEKNGQPSVIPQENPNYDKLPKELKKFANQ